MPDLAWPPLPPGSFRGGDTVTVLFARQAGHALNPLFIPASAGESITSAERLVLGVRRAPALQVAAQAAKLGLPLIAAIRGRPALSLCILDLKSRPVWIPPAWALPFTPARGTPP